MKNIENYYVYLIQNKMNGKIYIGKTNNLKQRWYRHRYDSANKTWSQVVVSP